MRIPLSLLLLAAATAACGPYPRRVTAPPVIPNGQRLPDGAATAQAGALPSPTRGDTAGERERIITQLVREGDDMVAANDLASALNRYDRASVLKPNDPDLLYKSARLLDLQLRPQEALMRYQKFLLSLDIERIKAQGDASAKMAEAIALAQQRILILEKQVK
ncbi:MAG: hypothetical protein K2X99_12965 [Gemmatimonadaceae bacterium]|nr:hypothetical protein [Gemmatimonadaceae bacterium]